MVAALSDGIACEFAQFGLLFSPTDPSEKRTEIGDRISECYDQHTANSKKVRAFSCLSWLKTFFDTL
jgi:hypothetical protein